MVKQNIRYFPIILFASVMGFAAFTIAVAEMELLYNFKPVLSSILITITTVLFVLNGSILIYRIFRYPENVRKDFIHPVKSNFFATISISLLLLSALYIDIHYGVSYIFWLLGMLLQLSLTLIILTRMFWQAPFDLKLFTPAAFIPIVGNLVVPISGFNYVNDQISWFFLAVGLFFSIVYMVFVFYRLFFVGPLPAPLLPSIFIALAPPSVGFVAYTNVLGRVDVFAQILYGLALFITLFLFIQLIKIIRGPFFLSAWAFLFPTAAFTVATFQMINYVNIKYYLDLGIFLLIFVGVLIIYLVWNTLYIWSKGKLSIPDK